MNGSKRSERTQRFFAFVALRTRSRFSSPFVCGVSLLQTIACPTMVKFLKVRVTPPILDAWERGAPGRWATAPPPAPTPRAAAARARLRATAPVRLGGAIGPAQSLARSRVRVEGGLRGGARDSWAQGGGRQGPACGDREIGRGGRALCASLFRPHSSRPGPPGARNTLADRVRARDRSQRDPAWLHHRPRRSPRSPPPPPPLPSHRRSASSSC